MPKGTPHVRNMHRHALAGKVFEKPTNHTNAYHIINIHNAKLPALVTSGWLRRM